MKQSINQYYYVNIFSVKIIISGDYCMNRGGGIARQLQVSRNFTLTLSVHQLQIILVIPETFHFCNRSSWSLAIFMHVSILSVTILIVSRLTGMFVTLSRHATSNWDPQLLYVTSINLEFKFQCVRIDSFLFFLLLYRLNQNGDDGPKIQPSFFSLFQLPPI